MITSVVMGGLNALGLVSYSEFTCSFELAWENFEVYRLLTGFLVPPPQAMQGLMEIYMLYSFSKGLEEGKFKKNLPDYLFYLLIIVPVMLIGAGLFLSHVGSLNAALLTALTFTWSIDNYANDVNFYFLPIKASLLPAVSLGFRLLVDGKYIFFLALTGSVAAYIYNCLETSSFGPLMSFFQGAINQNDNTHRLGTVNSLQNVWYYSTGHLSAPVWLKSVVSKYTGIDYNSAAFNRHSFAAVIPPKYRRGSSNETSKGSTSGSAFRGEGRRLGGLVSKE
ncbi:unnamed protein product [Ambrosiozyma monospora]|uniref:Derlin n=1 Tax=Ambrosiozyma monospora TaxID=43982 RepID=A0A9W7DIT6_AMBMO|nr:unnamed protein product [Ambrosiozyma monospora]